MKIIGMISLILSTIGCQTGVVPISQREYLYEKEGKSPSLGHRRPLEEKSESTSEVFVKRESLTIVPKEAKNYSGSLFSLNNSNHLLFTDPPRGQVGDVIDVAVQVNRSAKPKAGPDAPGSSSATSQAQNGVQTPPSEGKSLQDELVAALPKLEPGIPDPKVPSSIKMRVIRQLENGDVIVEAERASENDWEAHSIRAQARLPRDKVRGKQQITSSDLADIQWYESQNGEVTERESNLWEDEYTMRMAGFNEARSKMALDLENKRKDLEKVKERLHDRIVNVGKERGHIAQERERVSKLRLEAEQKLGELSKKVSDQDSLIDQQKETIKKQEQLLESLQESNDAAGQPSSSKTNLSPTEAGSKKNAAEK